ncbi:MAG: 30S ribosomal protein S4 [Candidatus Bathyarchaeia archaeon]
MGDPKKQRKKYEPPRHPWRMDQLEAELKLIGEYGLRNKRELWRYKTMLSKMRGIARSILGMRGEERERLQKTYFATMTRLGLLDESARIDDALDLTIKNLLDKRLQTLVYRRGLARTIHEARAMITHGHVMIGDRRVTAPGYIVKKDEEALLKATVQTAPTSGEASSPKRIVNDRSPPA